MQLSEEWCAVFPSLWPMQRVFVHKFFELFRYESEDSEDLHVYKYIVYVAHVELTKGVAFW